MAAGLEWGPELRLLLGTQSYTWPWAPSPHFTPFFDKYLLSIYSMPGIYQAPEKSREQVTWCLPILHQGAGTK